MKFLTSRILLVLCLMLSMQAFAQPNKEYSIKDKKAIKQYEQALNHYNLREMDQARTILEELTLSKPEFIEAQFMLAQLYDETGQTTRAIAPLTTALQTNPDYYPAGWLMLAECYFAEGNYTDAEKAVTKYMPYPKNDKRMEKRAQVILASCVFAKKALASPVPFEPINLGTGVNTDRDEYYPCITADQGTLLFTRLVKDDRAYQGKQEDFFISSQTNGKWSEATPIREINTPSNEGAPTLSADGNTLIFTACELADGSWGGNRQGVGSCDLFYSYRTADGWSASQNIGQGINTGSWESQPSYSADGQTLYFVRGKRSARGPVEQDIYYCYLNEKGQWSAPQKVPGRVNTDFAEESVMIHPDGRTLYFSSNGHPGMGGLDIYMSRMLPDGSWDTPVNLGYPINTYKDENSLQVTRDGQIALFASERDGGYGGLDLYQFELHPLARPEPVTYVQGIVQDKLSFKRLEAHLELIDLSNGKTVVRAYSDESNGRFLLCIPSGKDYALNVSKDGYLFHSENFSLKNYFSEKPYELDVRLQKLKAGALIVLENVFFETNSYALKPESRVELDKLVSLLAANPQRKVEIGGHTDNVGSDESNLQLSDNRAKSVVEYLISKGIDASRLTYKGYGESQPIADNESEEGRAKNRRTEFRVIE
jgi:outer membrane protein OmpA-like peptidoglycan-associated protein/Tol biopolymer transport system component